MRFDFFGRGVANVDALDHVDDVFADVGGMITDTLDGRLLCRIVRRADGEAAGRRYRRVLGWLIVALSYGVAAYNIAKTAIPSIELGETGYSAVGAALVTCVVLMWAWSYRSRAVREPHVGS